MNPIDAVRILKQGCVILDTLGVTHWLSAGTALGAFRDELNSRFLERDTDIDVGVLGDSDYYKIKSAFEGKGFNTYRTYQTKGRWSQLAFMKDGIIFDIYFFYPINDELVNYNEHGTMHKPISMIDNLEPIFVHGTCFNVPGPIVDYLVLRYGKGWETPAPTKVSWNKECANLTCS